MLAELLLLSLLGPSSSEPQLSQDTRLRSEIEDAARDSKQLADDLAGMLSRLEVQDSRDDRGLDVLEENSEIEAALEEMIERIERLSANTEAESDSSLAGILSAEKAQEDELRDTLIELENVAKDIELVAATTEKKSDSIAIENMAKILQDVSERIKGVEEAAKKGKESAVTAKKFNGLRKNKQLSEQLTDSNAEEFIEKSNFQDLLATFFGTTKKSKKTGKLRKNKKLADDSEDSDSSSIEAILKRLNSKSEDSQLARKPKQLVDAAGEKESRKGKSIGGSASSGKTSKPTKEEPVETCEDKDQSDTVQVCTPSFETRDSAQQFYSLRPASSQYCFNVTKTVCEERSQTVSKEVCTYEYEQKEVIAPARLAEIGFERKREPLKISTCEKKLVKDGYKEKEISACYLQYVDVPYRIPTVSERIEEFIELSAPVPEKKCRLVKYDVPEVVCKDSVNKECVTLEYLEKDSVRAQTSQVYPDYRGDCESRDLEQTTTVCTIEQKVKQPRYNRYNNAYRG